MTGDMEVDDYDVDDASGIASEHFSSAKVLPRQWPCVEWSCVEALLRFVLSPVIFAT